MKPKIIVIDDDKALMDYYITALEGKGFEITRYLGVDAIKDLDKWDAALIVLDIMMPPMNRYTSEETNEGLRTGVLLYRDIREVLPNTPIVILTNVKNIETLNYFNYYDNIIVQHKDETLPSEFADLVLSVIQNQNDK